MRIIIDYKCNDNMKQIRIGYNVLLKLDSRDARYYILIYQ